MPPLVVVPLPEDDETPDEDDIPEEDVVPADDEVPDEEEEVEEVPDEVPDDLLAEEVPDDEVPELLDATCVAVVEAAKVAPMPAAAAADSRPTCQVIFLTRRWPRSLDWRAAATSAAGATGLDLVTSTELPVIFCRRAEELLKQLSVSHRLCGTGAAPPV